MSSICEELIHEIHADDARSQKKSAALLEKIKGEYVLLLTEAAREPESVDRSRLLQTKADLEIPDREFLADAAAIAEYFRLSEILKNASNASDQFVRAHERLRAIEAQFKLDLQKARHDLGIAETLHGECNTAADKICSIGNNFPHLFECIKDNFRPRGFNPCITTKEESKKKKKAD